MRTKQYLKPTPNRPKRNTLFDITPIVLDIPIYDREDVPLQRLLGQYEDRNDAVCKLIQLMLYVVPNNKTKLMAGDIRTWADLTLQSIPSGKMSNQSLIRQLFLEIGRRMFIGSGYHGVVGDYYFNKHGGIVIRTQQYTGPRYNVMYSEEPEHVIKLPTIPML